MTDEKLRMAKYKGKCPFATCKSSFVIIVMYNLAYIAEAAISILLIICIMLQHRASGLTATFGGSGATFVQRRGAERVIFKLTIWLSVLFFVLAVGMWYIPQ